MGKIPTVQVQHPDGDGFMLINEADFDPSVHTRYGQDGELALPDGTSLQKIPGGRFKALVGDDALKYPEGHDKAGKDVVFASQEEAVAAIEEYVAAQSEE